MSAKTIFHCMSGLNARMVTNYRRGFGPTRVMMLFMTIGQKSGLPRPRLCNTRK